MMFWFRKNRRAIYLSAAVVFIVGSFAGFGGYFFAQSPFDAAVIINGRKVSYKRFQGILGQLTENQRRRAEKPLTKEDTDALRRQVIQGLVQESVFLDQADVYGVNTSDNELSAFIQNAQVFQKDGRFDPALYQQILRQNNISIPDFEDEQRRQLLVQKAQFIMASAVKISPFEYQNDFMRQVAQMDAWIRGGTAAIAKEPRFQGQDPKKILGEIKEEKKKLMENPAKFRDAVRQQEINAVLQEWFNQVSSQLKINIQLSKFEGK